MKMLKKTMALALAVMMAMAMCVTAFADSTVKLTISDEKNHSYEVYQVLTGDVSNLTDGKGTLSNVKAGSSANSTLTDANVSEVVELLSGTDSSVSEANLGNTVWSYVNGGAVYKTVNVTGGTATIDVAPGYYLLKDVTTDTTDSLSRYVVAVAGDTTVTPKTETPDIDKKIIDTDANEALDDSKKTDTAAIGDTIEYEVTGQVPDMTGYTYYYYVLNDTLSKGLTLDENSFNVTVGGQTAVKGTDYNVYVTKNDDGTTSFKLAFADMKDTYSKDAAISIKYNATVNKDAEIGVNPNTNTASLQYSNNPNTSEKSDKTPDQPGVPEEGPDSKNPTGNTEKYITKTYVTELKLTKTFDGTVKNGLIGAEFTLTGENLNTIELTTASKFVEDTNGTYWKLTDGTYTTDDPATEGMDTSKYESTTTKYSVQTVVTEKTTSADNKKVVATIGADGTITFTGLNYGTYTLSETKTPTGYNTASDINFAITRSLDADSSTAKVGGTVTWADDSDDVTYNADTKTFSVTVDNVSGKLLPSTGGIGTTIFYVVGTLLVVGAAVLLISKRRMHNA